MTESKLLEELSVDYQNIRVLDDGTIIGTHRLMFTHALHIGLNACGWERRYCYPSEKLAIEACNELKSMDDEPLLGYVAKRGF